MGRLFFVAPPLSSKQGARNGRVVPSDSVKLFEYGGSGSSARFSYDRGLVSGAARWIRASLHGQEGAVKAAFGVIGFDHDEASRG